MPSRPPPIPWRQRTAGSCGHRSPRRRSQPSRQRWSARPRCWALLDQEGAARSGVRMREEPAGLGPRDEACAAEPEFAAAFADSSDALDRATPATPAVTHSLTHTLFSMPVDATGRRRLPLDWTVAADRPRGSRTAPVSGTGRERVTQHGWTAMDTCGTNRTQPAESMRWGAGRTRKNRRTDTGGAARLEIAWHELGTPGPYRRTLGDAQQHERGSGANAPGPPPPCYPPRALRNDGLD